MGDEPAARAGTDASASFEGVLRGSARPMLQFADFVLDDLSAAEDAVQEAFIVAWRRRKTLMDPGDIRVWLRRIVLRECLRWRRHPMLRLLTLTDRVVTQPDTEATALPDVGAHVARLSPKTRAVALLHFDEGLSVAQVAAELEISVSTVEARLGAVTELVPAIQRHAADRSSKISENQAAALLSRAAGRWSQRRTVGRYVLNAISAAILALVIIAGGVVLQAQLHLFQPRAQAITSSGPLPPMPNEIVNLIDQSRDPGVVVPFRLRDAKALPSRPQWMVTSAAALQLVTTSDCATTTVRVVDPVTQKDVRPPVTLADCYDTAVILRDGTVLLTHWRASTTHYFQPGLGVIRYDLRAGRIGNTYPNLALPPDGGLVSRDGTILISLDMFSGDASRGTFLDFTDLASGALLAHIPIVLADSGGVSGGLALSTDGRTLFVNQGYQLASFDAWSGAAGPVVPFSAGKSASRTTVPLWVPQMTEAEANNGDAGHGIAVDPRGRMLAAVGYSDSQLKGIWLIGTSGRLSVLRRFYPSRVLRDLAFSLDGSVLYAIDGSGLVVFDPQTGREIRRFQSPTLAGVYRIAGIQAQ